MSLKRDLAEVVEELPESTNLEEMIERIYRAMKLKSQHRLAQRSSGAGDFASWVGKAKGLGENSTPRFSSDEDLWK